MEQHDTKEIRDRAVLVGLDCPKLDARDNADEDSMEELSALVETAGGETVGMVLQNRAAPDPRTFIGEGKVGEIRELVRNQEATTVIFDNDLSPSQMRVLTEELGVQVLDRSALILDIFAQRAKTKEGRLQVELAQYQYLLPRLVGMWTHLERQAGTSGKGPIGSKGPGETQLETDRRHIRRKIDKLKEELEAVRRVRGTQRQRRMKNEIPVAAIVGYTNAGKSTLLNALTGAGIPANNRLFDTLDTTSRLLQVSDTLEVVISDTVGFIRKLPHQLVERLQGHLGGTGVRGPAAPRHRHLQPPLAGAGGDRGQSDPGTGGGADALPSGLQQVGPLLGGHPAPRGDGGEHLRQDRGGPFGPAGRRGPHPGQGDAAGDGPPAL